MPENKNPSKEAIRKLIRSKRQILSKVEQQIAAKSCARNIINSNVLINKNKIAFYLAQDNELSLNNLINYCFENNQNKEHTFYLPALASTSHEATPNIMKFLEYNSSTKLKNNKYNILEPIANTQETCINPADLNLVFVPLVAFTKSGQRLGMGGGYYDRTFAFLTNSSNNVLENPILIGIAYDFQCVDYLPHQNWDINLYGIATEINLYKF